MEWWNVQDESGTSKCPCRSRLTSLPLPLGRSLPDTDPPPSSQVYSGDRPLSEPECAHLANFLKDHRCSLKAYLTLHAYGNLIIHTWNFKPKTYPEEVEELVRNQGRGTKGSLTNWLAEKGGRVDGQCHRAGGRIPVPGGQCAGHSL